MSKIAEKQIATWAASNDHAIAVAIIAHNKKQSLKWEDKFMMPYYECLMKFFISVDEMYTFSQLPTLLHASSLYVYLYLFIYIFFECIIMLIVWMLLTIHIDVVAAAFFSGGKLWWIRRNPFSLNCIQIVLCCLSKREREKDSEWEVSRSKAQATTLGKEKEYEKKQREMRMKFFFCVTKTKVIEFIQVKRKISFPSLSQRTTNAVIA